MFADHSTSYFLGVLAMIPGPLLPVGLVLGLNVHLLPRVVSRSSKIKLFPVSCRIILHVFPALDGSALNLCLKVRF